MIRCQLDTELPLDELRISVAEKRELDEPIESNGSVTLSGLPEGDLHLWFLQDEERLGEIKINAAKSGELIRLEIRLVTGNAILLEEFRITGLTETSSPAPSPPTSPVDGHTQTIDQTSDGETASSHCPVPRRNLVFPYRRSHPTSRHPCRHVRERRGRTSARSPVPAALAPLPLPRP